MRSLIIHLLLLVCLQLNAQEKSALVFSGTASQNADGRHQLRKDIRMVVNALSNQGFKNENIHIDSTSTDKETFLQSLNGSLQNLKKGDFLLLYFYNPVTVSLPANETMLVLNTTGPQTISFSELNSTLKNATGRIKDPAALFCIFNSDLSAIREEAAKKIFTSVAATINCLFASGPGEPVVFSASTTLFSRAFTGAITSGSSFISTYHDLLEQLSTTFLLYTTLQHPALYLNNAKLPVFNNRFKASPVYFTIRSQPADDTVIINAGHSLNILPGTVIRFYPAGTIDTAGKTAATGTVTASNELTATVKLSKSFPGAAIFWAIAGWNENEATPISPLTFNTGFMQASDPEKKKYFEEIVKGNREDPRLRSYVKFVTTGGDLQISDIGLMSRDSISCTLANPRTGRPLKDFYYSTKSKDIIYNTSGADKYSEVEEYLVSSAEWHHLSKLQNPVPGLQAEVSLKTVNGKPIQSENNFPVVYEEDELKLVIHNPQAKKIYFAIIALRADKSIKLLHPGLGEEASACQVLPGQDFSSDPMQVPALFGLEKIKIVTSTTPVNIEELRQQNILTRAKNSTAAFLPEYTNIQDFDYEIRSRFYAPESSGKKIRPAPGVSSRNMTIRNPSAEKIFFNVLLLTDDGAYKVLFPANNKTPAEYTIDPSRSATFDFQNNLENNSQLITVFADRPFLLTDQLSETRPMNELLVDIIRTGRIPGSPFNKVTLTQQVYTDKTMAATRGNSIIIKLINPRITPDKSMAQQALSEEYNINGFAMGEDNSAVKGVKINGEAVEYDKALKFFDKVLQLVPGNNKIVIEATDEKGFTESRILEVQLKKDNADANSKGTNYFLGIAIDQYQVWPPLHNAKNDVDSFSRLLVDKFGFEPAHIKMLTDSNATRKNIIRQIRTFLVTAKPNDNIIMYFSGHGNKDQLADGDYYFIPTDGEADDVSSNVKSTDIIDNFRNIKAKHCLLIMDACFSGLISNAANKQQISIGNANKNPADLPSKWIITSGRATKVSDGPPGTNSPFASVMLSYLRDNTDESKLTISKLIDYLRDNVPKFNKLQIPFGTSIAGEGELTFHISK